MYDTIKASSADRITEIRESIDLASRLTPSAPRPTKRSVNTIKGLVYVQLYGVIEYTILQTVSEALAHINSENISIDALKPHIWSLVLSDRLDALVSVNRKKWDKRYELFERISNGIPAQIDTTIMPTDGKNFTADQLQSIWNIFCITAPIFHDVAFRGRLQDIVINRINVAHGNVAAADVGANVSINDLYQRLTDVSSFCSYFISIFEDYCLNRRYYL